METCEEDFIMKEIMKNKEMRDLLKDIILCNGEKNDHYYRLLKRATILNQLSSYTEKVIFLFTFTKIYSCMVN